MKGGPSDRRFAPNPRASTRASRPSRPATGRAVPQAPIRFVVPVALKEVMAALTPELTRASGHRFEIVHRLDPEVPAHVASGAAWDVAVTNPCHVAEIVAAGHAAVDGVRPFGRSPLALAVRGATSGAARRSPGEIAATLREADETPADPRRR